MTKRIMSYILSILLISTSASMQAFPTYAKSSAKTTSPVYCTWYKSPSSPNWCWGNYVKVVKNGGQVYQYYQYTSVPKYSRPDNIWNGVNSEQKYQEVTNKMKQIDYSLCQKARKKYGSNSRQLSQVSQARSGAVKEGAIKTKHTDSSNSIQFWYYVPTKKLKNTVATVTISNSGTVTRKVQERYKQISSLV